MPDLANQLLFEFRQSSSVRLTASAVQLLVEQTWPGNITEVEPRSKACARRSSGDIIIAADFPARFHSTDRVRRLPPREKRLREVERDKLLRALDEERATILVPLGRWERADPTSTTDSTRSG